MPTSTPRRRSRRTELAALGPLDQLRAGHLPQRLAWLLVGLFLYGASMAMVLRSTLGQIPWDVFHVGLGSHLPFSFGITVTLVSFLVLLTWIPLRQMPGLGTIGNATLIGPAADLTLSFLPAPDDLLPRIGLMVGGVVLNGIATAMYVGAQLGPGSRDGLMTGLARVTGRSIRVVRTGMEVVVIVAGALLGGTLGVATVLYAVAIGPLTQAFLPFLTVRLPRHQAD
ncbi:membrane protein YczE [Kytococcus sp. Marseille-QA3725]